MNFPAVHTIPEAIIERTKHTTYGYFSPREEYFDAIIKWHKTRNGIEDWNQSTLDMKMVF